MAEPKSWIKLNRNILDWGWYKDGNTMRVFTHLLLIANVRDGRFMGILVKRGQIAVSTANIALSLDMSVKEVRTALEHLKTTKEIETKKFNRFSLITINNYELYQSGEAVKGQSKGEQKASGRQQSKNNRKKEVKKEKRDLSEEKPEDYKPQEWELEIPQEMWGRFSTEEDYWSHAEESEDA